MRNRRRIWFCLILLLSGISYVGATYQDTGHHVIDFVDLPLGKLTNGRVLNLGNNWLLEFRETWDISPSQLFLRKSVHSYKPKNRNNSQASPDSLQERFNSLIRQQPATKGFVRIRNISYEFMLLDPHLLKSGNIAFPEPDSMDYWTRKLQKDLISLVKPKSSVSKHYNYNEQLLSVVFHETWFIDFSALKITKLVEGITPVMWQRRQTNAGEPLDDPDTKLPVYYKIKLDQIDIRNP